MRRPAASCAFHDAAPGDEAKPARRVGFGTSPAALADEQYVRDLVMPETGHVNLDIWEPGHNRICRFWSAMGHDGAGRVGICYSLDRIAEDNSDVVAPTATRALTPALSRREREIMHGVSWPNLLKRAGDLIHRKVPPELFR